MTYTLLRLTPHGIVLMQGHLARLEARDGARRAAVAAWAASAVAGVWALTLDTTGFRAVSRPDSRLSEGMPARLRPSPVAHREAPIAKPSPPSAYDAVRVPGVATLLTSADGTEVWEACSAAAIGWDGASLVVVPQDRPRVASVSEAALRAAAGVTTAPIVLAHRLPIALVNAVKGFCGISLPGHPPLPAEAIARVQAILDATVAWP